ncbi:MAG: GNAT family N-acetyltransferase [Bacillaceae bacterium]
MAIHSERLLFRPYEDDDFEFLVSLLSNPEMMRFIGNGNTRDRNGAKAFLDWIYRGYEHGPDMGLKLLVRKEDNALIGHAGFVSQIIDGKEEIEIGYWIAPDYWRHGYATEAAFALKAYGISKLDRNRFIALVQLGNIASQKVATKIGMNVEKQIVLSDKNVYVYATI